MPVWDLTGIWPGSQSAIDAHKCPPLYPCPPTPPSTLDLTHSPPLHPLPSPRVVQWEGNVRGGGGYNKLSSMFFLLGPLLQRKPGLPPM